MAKAIAATAKPLNPEEQGGFFHPYKPGQGFWTRIGTGIGAGLVIAFTVQFLFRRLPLWLDLSTSQWPLYAILVPITLALTAFAWWMINRRRHAEFLINTDDEMKKVNWPGRRELIGSTKVVIAFMFFMAGMLFAYDIVFSFVMYAINVMKIKPPLWPG